MSNPSGESLSETSLTFHLQFVQSWHLVIEKHLQKTSTGIAALQDVLPGSVTTMWDSDPI
jgi:hypothetical protein